MTIEQLQAELVKLKTENASLKARKAPSMGIKVSAKGAVSVYGLGRWPVTLYKAQWEKLLAKSDEIKSFIKANESSLAVKEPAKKKAA